VQAAIMSHVRDVVQRPNSAVTAESIDNASVTYGGATISSSPMFGAMGGLRSDAAQILAPLRILESGL